MTVYFYSALPLFYYTHQRKSAARRAEVGGLALIQPRRNQLYLSVVNIAAHVVLERHSFGIIHANAAFSRCGHFLRDIITLQYLGINAPGQLLAAIRTLAAITAVRLEEPLLAFRPQRGFHVRPHHDGMRNTCVQSGDVGFICAERAQGLRIAQPRKIALVGVAGKVRGAGRQHHAPVQIRLPPCGMVSQRKISEAVIDQIDALPNGIQTVRARWLWWWV